MPAISRALGDTVHMTGLGELPPLNSHSGRPPALRTPGQSPDGPTGPMQQYQQPRGNANPAGRAPGASARCLGRRCRWYAQGRGGPPPPTAGLVPRPRGGGRPRGFPWQRVGGGWGRSWRGGPAWTLSGPRGPTRGSAWGTTGHAICLPVTRVGPWAEAGTWAEQGAGHVPTARPGPHSPAQGGSDREVAVVSEGSPLTRGQPRASARCSQASLAPTDPRIPKGLSL